MSADTPPPPAGDEHDTEEPERAPAPDARDTLADAVEWFHQQLDHDLPEAVDHDTPRDYYRDGRGWDADTINEKRLGYAPVDYKDELIAYLFNRGHDREAMLATGLFGERDDGNLYATWIGRYVLPYVDAGGRPVFAISRATTPVHRDDWKGNKYDKLPVTRADVALTEPMYGLDTVRAGEPVLITEGIADAITAHQAGYPCLSPVTVQFKKRDRGGLLEALEARGVDRAYLIQDAERPTSNVDDRDRLTLQQFGDGVKGAVRTAAYLSDHGLEARVADLPRPGLEKVDLDDYLQGWSDDLTPLLASANPVTEHPAYDDTTARDVAVDAAEASDLSRDLDAVDTDGDHSALFDLDIRDVAGLPWDYRGTNPLGHHGESENYCVLLEGHGVAYDHKYKVAYNALTYLLVDAGQRRPASPNGRLDDGEVFAAWRHAKREGFIPDDDLIPHRALQYVAREHGLADTEDLTDGWKLPREAYNAALATVREEYGVDPGRGAIAGNGGDVEPTAALALTRLQTLDDGQRNRYRQTLPGDRRVLSTTEVSDRIRDTLEETLQDEGYAILQAPTGGNKTGVAAETPWRAADEAITGDRPVVLFSETTDARDEAIERAREADLEFLVLRGAAELCPLVAGDYDPTNIDEDDPDAPTPIRIDGDPVSEWFARQTTEKGVPISVAHRDAEERLRRRGRECPCCRGEQECRTKTQWPDDGLTDDDGHPRYDLVIATDPFAYVPSLRANTNILHDEQPTYTEDFGLNAPTPEAVTARVRRAVTAFLRESDTGPDTFEALVELARACARCDATPWNEHAHPEENPDEELGRHWIETFSALEYEPPRRWYLTDPDAHTLAPPIATAIWKAITGDVHETNPDERGAGVFDTNGRATATVSHAPPRLDEDARDDDGWNRTHVTVTIDDENTIRGVRNTPDFRAARSVVGLDARPTPWLWQRNVHPDMTTERALDVDEARLWRRYERGQTVVQVGDATRPAGKEGRYFNDRHARAVVERLRDHFGDEFTSVGTAKALERATAGDHIDVGFRELLLEVGIPEHSVDDAIMTYGAEKSRNDFAEELVGLVYACIDPGDDYVLDLLAECGLDAQPERSEDCEHCGGDGCHECDGTGQKRAHGRGFIGPDADHATELLESVRATHVAQMIGRFGRNLDTENGEQNLTFVATDAVPPDLVDYQVPGVEWLATPLHREILAELTNHPGATTREIAATVSDTLAADPTTEKDRVGKEHVRQTLVRFEKRGTVQRRSRTGDHGADEWTASKGESARADDVQLRLDETANAPVQSISTWALAVSATDTLGGERSVGLSPPDVSTPGRATANRGDRPPDDAD